MTFAANVQASKNGSHEKCEQYHKLEHFTYAFPWSMAISTVHSPNFCPSRPCVGGPDGEHWWEALGKLADHVYPSGHRIGGACVCGWWTEGSATKEQTVCSYCLKPRSPHKDKTKRNITKKMKQNKTETTVMETTNTSFDSKGKLTNYSGHLWDGNILNILKIPFP